MDLSSKGVWKYEDIYKSRNFIYGFENAVCGAIVLSTKVEILYMDLSLGFAKLSEKDANPATLRETTFG